jgi:Ran GTPase-activating protein (RanGAP) involved in mRNA processing and transport
MQRLDLSFAGEGAWRQAAAAEAEERAKLREADCSWGPPSLEPSLLSALLAGCVRLTRLSLEGTRLSGAVCAALGSSLPSSLTELLLGSCFVGDAGLASVLSSPPPSLNRLSVALCSLTSLAPLDSLSLALLDVGSNALQPEAAEVIARLAERSPELADLRCSGAGTFGDSGVARIARALAFCPQLRILDLSHLGASEACGPHVSEALAACVGLVFVSVSGNCGLRLSLAQSPAPGKGLRSVEELSLGVSVTELVLSGEELVGRCHVDVLAAVSGSCPALRELRLDRCGVGDAGIVAAWSSYSNLLSSRLSLLSLCDNQLTGAGCDLFVSGIRSVPIVVRLYGNAVPAAQLAELHAVCSGGPAGAALLRRQSTPSAGPGSVSPGSSGSADPESEPFIRRAAGPNRALVPRPRVTVTLEHMAAKYGLPISPGSSPLRSESDSAETLALKEDRKVLLSLYQRLVAEHAEVCLAYDAAVARARGAGLVLPDLAAVKVWEMC